MIEDENIFLFDLDGSLADHNGALMRDLKLIQSPYDPVISEKDLWNYYHDPYMEARIDLIRKVPGWWEELSVLPLGMEIFDLASDMNFQTEVLTKGPKRKSYAWHEKVKWCQKHLYEDIEIHIVSNKSRVYGKVLYDDYPNYVSRWLEWRKRGLVIMPLYQSNYSFEHPNVLFWDGESDTKGLITIALNRVFKRKSGEPLDISDLKAEQQLEKRLSRLLN